MYYTAMQEILKLYKHLGETPLECIERFKAERPEYSDTPMTYLGRLDPMAEGLLFVLAGDTRNKNEYLEWNKSYEFEVLWGFETDTYDILGMITNTGRTPLDLEKKMPKLLKDITSKKTQTYPPFSSRTVGGKALHAWAREGRIDEIEIPTRSVKIFNIEHVRTRLLKQSEILEEILQKIALVEGNFRQEEISALWKKMLKPGELALISKFNADVSSGTYIRSLAHEMGKKLDTCALAYSIKRTGMGEHRL
jgi:tRNA pseudouridine55 synthase